MSEPAPKKTAATPAAPEPEAGRVKHVFVYLADQPRLRTVFWRAVADALPVGDPAPAGRAAEQLHAARGIGAPQPDRCPQRPATKPGDKHRLPHLRRVSPHRQSDTKGVIRARGCVYPVETQTFAHQLSSAQLSWHAYVEGMVDETGAPDNCVYPGPEEADAPEPGGYATTQNPFVYFHSLVDLGDCAANDPPIDPLTADLRKAEKTPNYSFIAPTPCESGASGQCRAGGSEGPANADAFLSEWVPKILASPAYKAGGLLIVNFASANPPIADPESAAAPAADPLRVGALLLSPFLTPVSTAAALTTRTRSSARATTSSAWAPRPGRRGQDQVLRGGPAQGKRRR